MICRCFLISSCFVFCVVFMHVFLVLVLFSKGSENSKLTLDLTVMPPCGTTVLHDAVLLNHVGVVKLLLEAGGKLLLRLLIGILNHDTGH